MHSISTCKRIRDFGQRLDAPEISKYTRAVTQIVDNGVMWIDDIVKIPDIGKALAEDLAKIVEFRDQYK